jgi:predicted PurR-regulated permease PerM
MIDPSAERISRRGILVLMLGGLLALSYVVLHLFFVPVAWAMIIAFATWPMYAALRKGLGSHSTLSALFMTLLVSAAFVLPTLWVVILLQHEIGAFFMAIAARIAQGPPTLPEFLLSVPWIGNWLQELLDRAFGDPVAFRTQVAGWSSQGAAYVLSLLGDVGRNAAKLGFALITLFFLYCHGDSLVHQVRLVLRRFLGARIDHYLAAVGGMTKAVVWGLVATALAQGFAAGLGYWWADVQAPVLLGAFTALIAMIPFGTPFVWGSIALWLLASGDTVGGIGLLLWGTLVVSWVDNLVRPLVISSATRIPFLLVMFGVLGGLAAFGLVGLFLGPVVLAVLMAVWREWLETSNIEQSGPAATPVNARPDIDDIPPSN